MDFMTTQTRRLRNVSIYPYYRGVPLELDAVASAVSGVYRTDWFGGHACHRLDLEGARLLHELHVGATYSCCARDQDDQPLRTHWLYCSKTGPTPSFGVGLRIDDARGASALPPDDAAPVILLERLTDLVAVFPSCPGDTGLSQAQIGRAGWLVMTRVGVPGTMGILVEDPVLPSSLCPGSTGLVLAGRSSRTTQAVSLHNLRCVSAGTAALFLREER